MTCQCSFNLHFVVVKSHKQLIFHRKDYSYFYPFFFSYGLRHRDTVFCLFVCLQNNQTEYITHKEIYAYCYMCKPFHIGLFHVQLTILRGQIQKKTIYVFSPYKMVTSVPIKNNVCLSFRSLGVIEDIYWLKSVCLLSPTFKFF